MRFREFEMSKEDLNSRPLNFKSDALSIRLTVDPVNLCLKLFSRVRQILECPNLESKIFKLWTIFFGHTEFEQSTQLTFLNRSNKIHRFNSISNSLLLEVNKKIVTNKLSWINLRVWTLANNNKKTNDRIKLMDNLLW